MGQQRRKPDESLDEKEIIYLRRIKTLYSKKSFIFEYNQNLFSAIFSADKTEKIKTQYTITVDVSISKLFIIIKKFRKYKKIFDK